MKMKTERRRFGIADLFLIFLFLLCLLSVGIRIRSSFVKEQELPYEEYLLRLWISGADPEGAETLSTGDAVYGGTEARIGHLLAVVQREHREYLLSSGQYYEAVWDPREKSDLEVTLLLYGYEKEGCLYLSDGIACLIGEKTVFYTDFAELRGRIISFEKNKNL